MKVVYDHQIFGTHKYGGISRYYSELATNLNALEGINVKIFSPLYVNEYVGGNGGIIPVGIKVPKLRLTQRALKLTNTALSWVARAKFADADIFHETYYSKYDICPRNSKRVVTVYDMIHEKFSRFKSKRDRTKDIKLHAVRRADHVICISERTRRDLIEISGVKEDKTSVVYLGYSLPQISVSKQMEFDEPFILYVGQRGGYKNFDTLLDVYAKTNISDEYSLVCFGGEGFSSRETSRIKKLGLHSKVKHYHGSDESLVNFYVKASLLVYPSLYEGFGIPPLEAMALGCPVVCANTGSLPEVAGNAAELFDPYDQRGMSESIEKVLRNEQYALHLINRGHERVKQFTWEECARKTREIYENLLNG